MKKKVISIGGPTATGKTSLAIKLARYFDTEIISADSRQFYKEMRIGTAVPTTEELAAAPHHFIQHKSIFENYTVGDFEKDFLQLTDKLFQKKDIIILVGGSGLFLDAACKGLDDLPPKNEQIRKELEENLQKNGIKSLQDELTSLDNEFFQKIDIHNPHRLIRAIEILRQSNGKKMSEIRSGQKQKRNFDCISIALNAERPLLYERINKRVDNMINEGLLEEVEKLLPHKALNPLNTVGYKELFAYFEGKTDLDFAISEIKKNTRRFAKRQITWFKKNSEIKWFDITYDFEKIIKYLENYLFTK